MKWGAYQSIIVVAICGIWASCSPSGTSDYKPDRSPAGSDYGQTVSAGQNYRPVPAAPRKSPTALYREVNVRKDIIPRGRHARKYRRSMSPRYITIHSTQNYARGADALRHSLALKNGKLRARKRKGGNRIGYLVWHFTVDQTRAVQHLPTNEQGEHADFDGHGNRYSIGIEMCENRGNSRSATIERTAKLTAYMMHKYNIPLRKVVPHYHWPRRGLSKPHKNCPHYLLDNGRPGAKWQWFLSKVNKHYKDITTKVRSSAPARHYVTTPARPAPVASTPTRAVAVNTPVRKSVSKPVRKPTPPRPSYRYHTVKRGDTLYSLSRRYSTSVAAIQRSNSLRGTVISLGKRLKIPR